MNKNIFVGIGLGLLIGTIIGLSISEVTGVILGALTSILSAFFGFRSNSDGEDRNQYFLGTFCIACFFSIFLGMYIRTYNLFSPPISYLLNQHKDISFSKEEIKNLVLFKEFGLIPNGYSLSNETKLIDRNSVLHAGEKKSIDLCETIDANTSLSDIKIAYNESGSSYGEIANQLFITIKDTTDLKNSLLALKKVICDR